MSKNPLNNHSVRVPAEWSLPKFDLGQKVSFQTGNPPTTKIRTGQVVGIEYFKESSISVTRHGVIAGWHYTIASEDGFCRWYCSEAILWVEELDIGESEANRSLMVLAGCS